MQSFVRESKANTNFGHNYYIICTEKIVYKNSSSYSYLYIIDIKSVFSINQIVVLKAKIRKAGKRRKRRKKAEGQKY